MRRAVLRRLEHSTELTSERKRFLAKVFTEKILALGTRLQNQNNEFLTYLTQKIFLKETRSFKELKSGIVTFFLLAKNAETKKVPRKKTRRP